MLLHSIKIGNVELENNIFLAPMAGVTDKAFRKIVQSFGAFLTCTEMISSKALHYKDKKTEKLMDVQGEKRPIAIQLFGSESKIMGEAAENVCNLCDIIDINLGCPAPKIVKNGDGSKLLQEPKKIEKILSEVVKKSTVPVTVKIRSGWDKEHIVAEEVAKIAENTGASAITIHGRTKEQYYSGDVDLEIIKKVKKSVKIPVIGNGDINSAEAAKKMLEYTGVDGIMIGRAALGNPWIFLEIIEYLKNGKKFQGPSNKEKLKIMLKHLEYEIEEKGETIAVKEMRKHFSWYIKNLPDAAKARESINKAETELELESIIKEYFKKI